MEPKLEFENQLAREGYRYIAGVDEVGRGPLAGPVVAAAVIFRQGEFIEGVKDSKALTASKREILYYQIRKKSLCYAIGIVSSERIDEINIRRATFEAMNLAIDRLKIQPDFVLVDGRDEAIQSYPQRAIIKGDALSHTIGAASILAKVVRDKMMKILDRHYPAYKFAGNKGYGSADHIEVIKKIGRCPVHRKTFLLKHERPEQRSLPF